jgi:hypothetical protein
VPIELKYLDMGMSLYFSRSSHSLEIVVMLVQCTMTKRELKYKRPDT